MNTLCIERAKHDIFYFQQMANVPSITLPLPFIIQKRGDHSGTWHVALCPCPPLPPANFPGLGNVSSTPPPAILPGCWLLCWHVGRLVTGWQKILD